MSLNQTKNTTFMQHRCCKVQEEGTKSQTVLFITVQETAYQSHLSALETKPRPEGREVVINTYD